MQRKEGSGHAATIELLPWQKLTVTNVVYLSIVACSLQIAVDSIENIRTVAALGVEDNFFHQFRDSVKAPYK